jgi:hypothetical protein
MILAMYDRLLVLLWMGVIFWGSSRSTLPGPLGSRSAQGELLRTCTHLAEYGILAVSAYRAAQNTAARQAKATGNASAAQRSPCARWKVILLAFAVALAYAILDEWHQSFVPRRQFTLPDIGLDATGAAVALALVLRIENDESHRIS